MDRQYPHNLVSLFVWKPFLAIREIAAAGSKLQYAALPQLRKSHAWFLLSCASPHLRFWRAPDFPHMCGLVVAGCTQLRSKVHFEVF